MSTPTTPTLQSAAPSATPTAAEKKKRFDDLRSRLGKSKLEVKGKPGLHYFWAHKTDDAELIRLDTLEYYIVKEPNVKEVLAGKVKPEIVAAGLKQDGTYQVGDTILLACPQDVYEFFLNDISERHKDQARSAKDNFRVEAEKAGAPVFEFDRK